MKHIIKVNVKTKLNKYFTLGERISNNLEIFKPNKAILNIYVFPPEPALYYFGTIIFYLFQHSDIEK